MLGADRVAANGDVANKIGTYQVTKDPFNTLQQTALNIPHSTMIVEEKTTPFLCPAVRPLLPPRSALLLCLSHLHGGPEGGERRRHRRGGAARVGDGGVRVSEQEEGAAGRYESAQSVFPYKLNLRSGFFYLSK